MRLKCDGKDGWVGWNEFDEEEQRTYGDQLLEIVEHLWIADYHSLNSMPVEASEIDATEVHTPELDERVYELERFVDGLVVKRKAHEKRLANEEDPPDEKRLNGERTALMTSTWLLNEPSKQFKNA